MATSKNIHKFTFGKGIDAKTIRAYVKQVYGTRYKVSKIEFMDSHYWVAIVQDSKTKVKTSKPYRMDYFCSYERVPRELVEGAA